MAQISWGKPGIYVLDIDDPQGKIIKLPDPAQGSTSLDPTRGEKTEAKVEGGENEDVKYNKNTYVLQTTLRIKKGRSIPIKHDDGLVLHKYAVVIVPEDPGVDGYMIQSSTVSVEDHYTATDGGSVIYFFDVTKPTAGHQVKLGKLTVTAGSGSTVTGITILDQDGKTYNMDDEQADS